MDIAFDTSALAELTTASIERVATLAEELNARIILPFPVLHELADGSDEIRALGSFGLLKELRARAGSRVVVSDDLDVIIERELRGLCILRTPRIRGVEAKAIRVALGPEPINLDGFRRVRAGIAGYLRKDLARQKDEQAREEVRKHLSGMKAADLKALFDDFPANALSLNNPTISALTKGRGHSHLRHLRRTPERFSTLAIYAGYTYLIMMGSSFVDKNLGPYARILRGPRSGSWRSGHC